MQRRVLCVLIAPVLLCAAPVAAQGPGAGFTTDHATGFGYTGAVPRAEIGVGAFHLLGWNRLGVFADAKMTLGSVRDNVDYCPPAVTTCDVEWAESNRNDLFVRDIDEWLIVNAGLIRAVTPELALMAGGGAARRMRFREYYDDVAIGDPITPNRGYFVDDPRFDGWVTNFAVGAMFRVHRHAALRFGYETAPGGLSLGGYLLLSH
jgi:hypothetical protein